MPNYDDMPDDMGKDYAGGELHVTVDTAPVKSGVHSTEFWLHLVGQIVAFCIGLGLITSSAGDAITSASQNIGAAIVALASAWAQIRYGQGRVEVKKEALWVGKNGE